MQLEEGKKKKKKPNGSTSQLQKKLPSSIQAEKHSTEQKFKQEQYVTFPFAGLLFP